MVKYIIVKYQKFRTIYENTSFSIIQTPLKSSYKKHYDALCGTNISSTKIILYKIYLQQYIFVWFSSLYSAYLSFY